MKKQIPLISKSEYYLAAALSVTMIIIPWVHYYCVSHNGNHSTIALAVYLGAMLCRCAMRYSLAAIKKIKPSVYEWLFTVLIIFMFISVVCAYDSYVALYGESGRNEGFFMLLCYFMFFYSARFIFSSKNRIMLIHIYLAVMATHSVYGLLQFFDIELGQHIIDSYHYAVSGVAGNPNFMGTLMVMAFGVSLGMALYTVQLKNRAAYSVLSVLFAAVAVLTRTLSAYLGIAVVLFTLMLYTVWKTGKKDGVGKAVILLVFFTVSAVIAVLLRNKLLYGLIFGEIRNILYQLTLFLQTGYVDEYFASGRLYIWKNILAMVPENPWTGVGIDCLTEPYYSRFGLFAGRFVDKAHNELLQILVTTGLPAALCYTALYISVIRDGISRLKSENASPLYIGLFAALCGYLAQAMFNISVIDVAPYFWTIAGLIASPVKPFDAKSHSSKTQ